MQTEKEYLVTRDVNALRCESVGEYSLPDYNADIKKVLMVKCKVFPSGKFLGEDSLEFSGSVGYEMVYLDSDNNVTHAEFSTDYDAALKVSAETYVDSDISTRVSSCNMRLVGPRKLSVKCLLDSDVNISERRTYNILGDAFMDHAPEAKTGVARIYSSDFLSIEPKEIEEELCCIDGAIADEVEILLSDAKATIEDIEASDAPMELGGNLTISLLYRNADETPRFLSKTIPCSWNLAIDKNGELDTIRSRVEISPFKCYVRPVEDGVTILASATLNPKISLESNYELDLTLDAYLKEKGSYNEYTELSYVERICNESKEVRFESGVSLEELSVENVCEPIYVEASAKIHECELTDTGVKITGEVRFNGILLSSIEDHNVYSPLKISLPFEENVNINCQMHENMRLICNVDTSDVKMDMRENAANLSCVLGVRIGAFAQKRQKCLSASYLTEEDFIHDESVVTVYYPERSESLFDIAKRFHTSVGAIARDNRLAESVFSSVNNTPASSGIRRLIIK